jgi:hypothetical protein
MEMVSEMKHLTCRRQYLIFSSLQPFEDLPTNPEVSTPNNVTYSGLQPIINISNIASGAHITVNFHH